MRKYIGTFLAFLLVVAAGSVAPLAFGQNNQPYRTPWYFAADYGQWSILSQTANVYQWSPSSICQVPASGTVVNPFLPFATNAPVQITDATPANSEVKTPSAIIATNTFCGITIAPSNQHFSFRVSSGTGGLQEAINNNIDRGNIPGTIFLDRNWYALANAVPGTNANAIIAAAVGDYTVFLQDITTSPATVYAWSGSTYQSTNNVIKNTAPTIAAGAAAGTGPTVSNAGTSTSISGVANVTSGTATTTGALFTETWPTPATGGPQYAGTCTVTSIGSVPFTTFTVATSFTTARVLTVTATVAPAVSTSGYQFQFTCK